MVGECVRFLCTGCERTMSKQNIKVSKQIRTGLFLRYLAFGLSQGFSSFRYMFFIQKTLLLFDIKAR